MDYYKTDNRRKPKIRDGIHFMQCIARAVGEMFHVSPEFLEIPVLQYNDYFQQLLERKYIRRLKDGHFIAENFSITPEGTKFYKLKRINIEIEQSFNCGLVSTKISAKKEI